LKTITASPVLLNFQLNCIKRGFDLKQGLKTIIYTHFV
jgi:hypothetical protein